MNDVVLTPGECFVNPYNRLVFIIAVTDRDAYFWSDLYGFSWTTRRGWSRGPSPAEPTQIKDLWCGQYERLPCGAMVLSNSAISTSE